MWSIRSLLLNQKRVALCAAVALVCFVIIVNLQFFSFFYSFPFCCRSHCFCSVCVISCACYSIAPFFSLFLATLYLCVLCNSFVSLWQITYTLRAQYSEQTRKIVEQSADVDNYTISVLYRLLFRSEKNVVQLAMCRCTWILYCFHFHTDLLRVCYSHHATSKLAE